MGAPEITIDGTGVGNIEATMGGNAAASVKSTVLTLLRDAKGVYICQIDGSSASGFKASYAPSACDVQ